MLYEILARKELLSTVTTARNRIREQLMDYRGPGFLAVVRFDSSSPLSCP
jgi:hypothetical protein